MPPSLLAPLLSQPETVWINLQTDPGADRLGLSVLSLTDFADTASVIANLDLVVTVDTAVAHLAGATGKPAWVMLPHAPDWRWLLHRADSPWYATLRLFRQAAPGDWPGVIQAVVNALNDRARSIQLSPSRESQPDFGATRAQRARRKTKPGSGWTAASCRREGTKDQMADYPADTVDVEDYSAPMSERIAVLETLAGETRIILADLRSEMREARSESASMRQDMNAGFVAMRQDMNAAIAAMRQEIVGVRQDMSTGFVAMRQDMNAAIAAVRQETAGVRQDMNVGFADVRRVHDRDFRLTWGALIGGSLGLLYLLAHTAHWL